MEADELVNIGSTQEPVRLGVFTMALDQDDGANLYQSLPQVPNPRESTTRYSRSKPYQPALQSLHHNNVRTTRRYYSRSDGRRVIDGFSPPRWLPQVEG